MATMSGVCVQTPQVCSTSGDGRFGAMEYNRPKFSVLPSAFKSDKLICGMFLKGGLEFEKASLLRHRRLSNDNHFSVKVFALAMEATKEAPEKGQGYYSGDMFQNGALKPIDVPPPNRADNPSLHNPLLRQERMGCGWLAVILEWEGIIVEDDSELETKAWTALAEEEGKRIPPAFILKRAEGMKNEQAISEVLCWSRDYREMKRLSRRKEELYEQMQRGTYRVIPGSRDFIETLRKYKIPVAIASTRPREALERAIEAVGMEGFFDVVIAAEDVYRGKPDPEMFIYAAEKLQFIPERCIVFGNSNSSVEAAHDACMKCVGLAGKHPVYELGAADLVARRLNGLSVVDLKNLADLELLEFQPPAPELEPEPEPEVLPKTGLLDW